METTLTKLEILENIIKSDEVIANAKICILSKSLPEDLRLAILYRATGMVDMAEQIANKNN